MIERSMITVLPASGATVSLLVALLLAPSGPVEAQAFPPQRSGRAVAEAHPEMVVAGRSIEAGARHAQEGEAPAQEEREALAQEEREALAQEERKVRPKEEGAFRPKEEGEARLRESVRIQEVDLDALRADIDTRVAEITEKVVAWRRDLHQHPELGNREFRTAEIVADHLRSLGMEVRAGVAHTGVVGLLRGGLPGPVVALRADMDALPVTEMVDLPFASRETTEYNGQEVGVMHACGHDNHVAILMGVAEVLAGMRDRIPGSVKFIFQPAEEGAPAGESGGASLMVREGVLEDPRPDAIFGLHVMVMPTGSLAYRPGGAMASAQTLSITVRGSQTHGAMPWNGIDPIVVSSQIVLGLQTIVSRRSDITQAPAVVTIGSIHGGLRSNIIPDSVVMVGTVRTLDPGMQTRIEERIRRTVKGIAESAGASADVYLSRGLPITYNDPDLTARMVPTLERVAGSGKIGLRPPSTGAEDFSYYQQEIPGLYFFLGVIPDSIPLEEAAPNHSPYFFADELALPVGVRALANLAVDFLAGSG